jgi:HEAT repeat protein
MKHVPVSIRLIMALITLARIAYAEDPYAPVDFQKADGKNLIHMLKVIRSSEYSAAVPVILPLLHNRSENVVRDTCRTLAVIGKSDVISSIEPLLNDKRANVRADAQNAVNVLRGEDGKKYPAISILDSWNGDPGYAIETLKLIRRPEFAAALPMLVALLKHPDENVVRDSCRTLAVIADKSVIPSIQPLTTSRNKDIRKDATNAIAKLEARS